MNDLERLSLLQVNMHTCVDSKTGIPVKKSIADTLVARGYVERCTTPDYMHLLKRSEQLTAVRITPKGCKKADEADIEEFENTVKQALELVDSAAAG